MALGDGVPIDAVPWFDVVTHDPDTGQIHDADSVPVFDIFEDNTDTPILAAQSTTKRTSKTGDYRGSFTASAANGFEVGKSYNIVVSGTVTGSVSGTAITAKKVAQTFRCVPAELIPGEPLIDVAGWKGATAPAMTGDAYARIGSNGSGLTSVAIGTGGIAAAAFAAGAIDSASINATGVTKITAGNFAFAFPSAYNSLTFQQLIELMSAALLAKCSGMATTTGVFRNLADNADTISATIDANGNRTAVTLTP